MRYAHAVRACHEERTYYRGMRISTEGTWLIGASAIALFAVLVSYASPDLKARTAAQVASGYYGYDDWGYEDAYGGYGGYEYGTPYGGYETGYEEYGYGPGGSVGYSGVVSGVDRYGPYEEYYEEWYEPTPRTSYAVVSPAYSGWSLGSVGSAVPFPAIASLATNLYVADQRQQQINAMNQQYYNQQLLTTINYNNRVAYSNYVASQPRLPQPSCTLKANPTSVPAGGSTTLTWGSQYATAATLDAVGAVQPNGSYTVSNITTARTFGLAATGPGGTGACYALVSVRAPAQQLTCLISTNPVIIQRGQSASLAWGTTGGSAATLTGPGGSAAVPMSGAITIAPALSTNYTVVVRDSYGNTQSCTTGIVVQ